MKTKNIFKTLAMAMLLPAMLLTTACSSDDDDAINNNENIVNNTEQTAKKGYPLQVTVNVTREGDEATTRATFNGTKLSFSTGDQLFVAGSASEAGEFAGTLTWVSEGTFSGTITTKNPYSGTADALFTAATDVRAALLPAGYGTPGYFSIEKNNGYDDDLILDKNKAFATSKAAAVEQFSDEYALEYSGGFTLSPYNAILYFTISGLSASTSVDVALTGPSSLNITGSVTTNLSGEATFAVGVDGGTDFNNLALTVDGNVIPLASGSKTLTAGKIYNVNRSVAPAAPTGAIDGLFTVNGSGDQVYFSKGNLQAVGTTSSSPSSGWTWQFAEHQWDYIGGKSSSSGSEPQTGNNYINGNGSVSTAGTVDLFCWSTNATYYGIHNSYDNNDYSGDFRNWGNNITGWRTLTYDEWGYLINTRTTTSDVRFAKAKVNNVNGLILLPDDWSTSYYALSSTNTVDAAFTANEIDASTWASSLEAHGAVFLPAAGNRYIDGKNNNYVSATELAGFYWSSVPYADEWNDKAYNFFFNPDVVDPSYSTKNGGCSVRLVKDAN